jgi:N-acetylglutamate synthase-like GNAT family acetyltransferase
MYKIRQAKKSDWRVIKKIIELNSEHLMQEHLPSVASFFVCEKAGQVVGCCALDIYSKKIAEIRSLAVIKEHRGNNIGHALIRACIKRAKSRKIKEVLAITGRDKLFKEFGFDSFKKEKKAVFLILD